ncbi:MAG: hypothetical protein K8T91_10035 [Planctomycetes bacterium]|nr:hypothetical protein [Planctomycetota bacterium]
MKFLIMLLVINALAVVIAAFLFFYAPQYSDLRLRLAYIELDRAQVINQEKLAVFAPSLKEDDRNRVPLWMAESVITAEKRNAKLLVIFSTLNVILLVIAIVTMHRNVKRSQRLHA